MANKSPGKQGNVLKIGPRNRPPEEQSIEESSVCLFCVVLFCFCQFNLRQDKNSYSSFSQLSFVWH